MVKVRRLMDVRAFMVICLPRLSAGQIALTQALVNTQLFPIPGDHNPSGTADGR
jgi:hypothetical protein